MLRWRVPPRWSSRRIRLGFRWKTSLLSADAIRTACCQWPAVKARSNVLENLEQASSTEGGFVLAATASLLGEGSDCPPLDTLFVAFPIKFKGSVVQYVGRVLRPTSEKTRVEVHDYVDTLVPVLARMYDERRAAYVSLGFDVPKRRRRTRSPQLLAGG